MGQHSAMNLVKARAALATRVAGRRLRQNLSYKPRAERDTRFALSRAEQKLIRLRQLDWRCPICGKAVFDKKLWVFPGRRLDGPLSGKAVSPCCKKCHMAERGVREGRPRDPDPPADMICPRCKLPKPHRGQWKLKLGICRQCARRPDRLVVHR